MTKKNNTFAKVVEGKFVKKLGIDNYRKQMDKLMGKTK